jgi:hypothetical protein
MTEQTKARRSCSWSRQAGPGHTAPTRHYPSQRGECGAGSDVLSCARAAAHSQWIRGKE